MAEYVSKVQKSDGTVIIDISQDTVTAAGLASGLTAHGADGAPITGTSTYDVDSSGCTALASEVLAGKTFAKNGQVLTGTMPNNGSTGGTISDASTPFVIPAGYSDGSAEVGISSTELAKLQPENIKEGVELLGVLGTYSGAGVTAQVKSATPALTAQTILPDSGYDYLSEVDIAAIPFTYTENAAGGYTVTIG